MFKRFKPQKLNYSAHVFFLQDIKTYFRIVIRTLANFLLSSIAIAEIIRALNDIFCMR